MDDEIKNEPVALRPKRWRLGGLIVLIIVAVAAGTMVLIGNTRYSPVPENIQKAVSFPIYYPDQNKLPAGYRLNTQSFANPVKNGVSYAVNYGDGQKLVFSLQAKPSQAELQSFDNNFIPLHNQYQTAVGNAEIGAYTKNGKIETLISLPTNDSAWIVITGPYNIDQNQMQQVLSSLKK